MMTLRDITDTAEWSALGTTVVHFLWQGAIIGLLAVVILRLLRHRPAAHRYAVACGAMLACLATFVVTLLVVLPSEPTDAFVTAAPASAASPGVASLLTTPSAPGHVDVAAWCWVLGFFAMTLRYLRHWMWARRLKSRQVSPPDARWQTVFASLREELGISPSVTMLRSGLAETAMVVGWFQPVVLVPVCAFTSLTPGQLRAVLAHELAHIRRHDQWINLAQGLVEVILFFHPVTWWLSRRINIEREYCCDDSSIRATGCPRTLAEALTRLESLRLSSPATGLAANGGSLMDRITRILGNGADRTTTNQKTNNTMNKTIGTIGAVTLLIGSLFVAQADEHRGDGLSREDFERAAAVLKKGAAEGKITEEAAKAGIEGMRAAMAKEGKKPEAKKPMNREDAGKIHAEIRKAVAEGKITEEEARKKMERLRRAMADQGQRDGERNPREVYARAKAELMKAVEAGKITEEQAKERLEQLKNRLAGQGQRGGERNPREMFARAEAELKKAVEEGKITEEQARERLQGMRKRLAAQGQRGGQPNPREAHAKAAAELKKAVESGRITEEQARERLQAMRREMAGQGERNAREAYARAEDAMEKMVEEGKITEEQAKDRLEQMRKRMKEQRERGERGEEERPRRERGERKGADHDLGQAIGERLKTAGGRLKAAVESGDMTADEAWAKWNEIKKTQVAPRVKEAVKSGKMTEEEAKALWHGIEKAEFGEKLKAAVKAGEMSEEDAKAKWEAFEHGDKK